MTENVVVVLMLTKHVSSACYLCRKRNEVNEGFIEMDMLLIKGQGTPQVTNQGMGYILYCIDCYEMLRKLAMDDFKGFGPFYEMTYEEKIEVPFPPELVCSARDPFKLWRNKLDVDSWLDKLAEERAGNPG